MIIIDNHRILNRTVPNIPQNPDLFAFARKNRHAGNLAEVVFWREVRSKHFYGIDFNRQYVFGNYIADFYIRSLGVVVEIDGAYHNNRTDYDQQREEFMSSLGILNYALYVMSIKYGFAVMSIPLPRPTGTPSARRGMGATVRAGPTAIIKI